MAVRKHLPWIFIALALFGACSRANLPQVAAVSPDWWTLPQAQKVGRVSGSVKSFDVAAMCRKLGDLPASLTFDAWQTLVDTWTTFSPERAARGDLDRAYTVAIQKMRAEVFQLLQQNHQWKRAKDFKWVTTPLGRADRAQIELNHLTRVIIDSREDSTVERVCERALLGFVYVEWIRAVDPLSRWVPDEPKGVAQAAAPTPEFSWRWLNRKFGSALIFEWNSNWDGEWTDSASQLWSELLEEIADTDGSIQWVWDLRTMPENSKAPRFNEALNHLAGGDHSMRGWVWLAPGATPPQWLVEWHLQRPLAYASSICETNVNGLFPGKKWVLSCGPAFRDLPVPELSATDPWTESLAVELTRTRAIPNVVE